MALELTCLKCMLDDVAKIVKRKDRMLKIAAYLHLFTEGDCLLPYNFFISYQVLHQLTITDS